MYVCGKYLKEQGKLNGNTVVTTVMSNMGLYKALEREGMRYEQTAVGDKYVVAQLTVSLEAEDREPVRILDGIRDV